MRDLAGLSWTTEELPQALALTGGAAAAAAPPSLDGVREDWLRRLAAEAGLEADPVVADDPLPTGPRDTVLVEARRPGEPSSWWLLTGGWGSRVRVLGRAGRRRLVDRGTMAAVLGLGESREDVAWAEVLAAAGIAAGRRTGRRGPDPGTPVSDHRVWRLRPSSDLPLGTAAVRWGVTGALVALAVAHLCQYLLWVGSWWLLGWGALGGRLEPGWLAAWALLLLSRLPFNAAATASAGQAVLRFGLLLRRRLLAGALRLDLDTVRTTGVGQLTGRLLEASVLETQVFHGGLLTLTAAIELGVAMVVLGAGAGGALHVLLLCLWLGLLALCAMLEARARLAWTLRRLEVADLVVDRIAGHTTRVVQQAPERWHEGEDEAVAALAVAARRLDRVGTVPLTAVRRSWLVVGVAGLGPALMAEPADLAAMAVGLGGVLLAAASLTNLGSGIQRLVAARVAWRQMRQLLRADRGGGDRPPSVPPPGPGRLTVRELTVRRGGRVVLDGLGLEVRAGDHVVVEGGSGAGKTVLAETLLALERPESGLILIDGLDPAVLQDRWRLRVGGVPEPARDHLLAGSLAFNVLLGCGWPATAEDLERAAAVCRELGLGELLERMPSGLHTQVGDTGWQLSHGERSRVLLARALLRDAGTLVLDTPFEGLDPVTRRRAEDAMEPDGRGIVLLARGS